MSVHSLDTGRGEGFVADAAVFAELDCRAACVATSVVVPHPLAVELVAEQLEAAGAAGRAACLRIGFLRGAPQAALIGRYARDIAPAPTVLASPPRAGPTVLLDAETEQAIRRELFPAARVVVVRAADAAAASGRDADDIGALRESARRLRDEGVKAVVIAGLLVRGRVLDLLDDDGEVTLLDTARIQVPRIPGLAGAYAAALTAHLARRLDLAEAAEAAQRYIGFRLQRRR